LAHGLQQQVRALLDVRQEARLGEHHTAEPARDNHDAAHDSFAAEHGGQRRAAAPLAVVVLEGAPVRGLERSDEVVGADQQLEPAHHGDPVLRLVRRAHGEQ
jgi:hypothetical protein